MLNVPDGDAPDLWPAVMICFCTAVNPRHSNRTLTRDVHRRMCGAGIPTLSFDFTGVGDSEGELRENLLIEIYRQIEKGAFVHDALDAIRFMRERFPSKKMVLAGNCGGSITALHAAAVDAGITHLVLMALPVTLYIVPGEDSFDGSLAKETLGDYLKRLRTPENWRKLINAETNYARIWSAFTSFARETLGLKKEREDIESGLNRCFLSSFRKVKERGIGVLCVFGGRDHEALLHYQNLFLKRYALFNGEPAPCWKTHIIEDASHDFYTPAARAELIHVIHSFFLEEGIIETDSIRFPHPESDCAPSVLSLEYPSLA